jgi:hypothetical protein
MCCCLLRCMGSSSSTAWRPAGPSAGSPIRVSEILVANSAERSSLRARVRRRLRYWLVMAAGGTTPAAIRWLLMHSVRTMGIAVCRAHSPELQIFPRASVSSSLSRASIWRRICSNPKRTSSSCLGNGMTLDFLAGVAGILDAVLTSRGSGCWEGLCSAHAQPKTRMCTPPPHLRPAMRHSCG